MPFSLIHCIYASAATRPFTTPELTALLQVARDRNKRLDVTGMLLYVQGSFFQVLEGQAATVDALLKLIEADPRHNQLTVIIREPITHRSFKEWTMGFLAAAPQELDGIVGVNDFLGGRTLSGIDAGRAQKLLTGFRGGHWRKKPTSLPLMQ
jgi:hypothetical protein